MDEVNHRSVPSIPSCLNFFFQLTTEILLKVSRNSNELRFEGGWKVRVAQRQARIHRETPLGR